MCEQSLPVISKSDNGSSGRSYPIKLSKTSLNAHNLMLNQERVSGIPVVINSDKYKKKKLNERQLKSRITFSKSSYKIIFKNKPLIAIRIYASRYGTYTYKF